MRSSWTRRVVTCAVVVGAVGAVAVGTASAATAAETAPRSFSAADGAVAPGGVCGATEGEQVGEAALRRIGEGAEPGEDPCGSRSDPAAEALSRADALLEDVPSEPGSTPAAPPLPVDPANLVPALTAPLVPAGPDAAATESVEAPRAGARQGEGDPAEVGRTRNLPDDLAGPLERAAGALDRAGATPGRGTDRDTTAPVDADDPAGRDHDADPARGDRPGDSTGDPTDGDRAGMDPDPAVAPAQAGASLGAPASADPADPADPTNAATAEAAVTAPLVDPGRAALDFAAALPAPGEIEADLPSVLDSVVLALALLAVTALPAGLVNRTAARHAERIARTPARLRVPMIADRIERLSPAGARTLVTVAAAAVYVFLQPTLGPDLSSLALLVGLTGAFVVVAVVAAIARRTYLGRLDPVRDHRRLFPAIMLLALACVVASRLAGLQPGLILGTLVTFATTRAALHGDLDGRAKAVTAASLATVGALAWVLREPLVALAGPTDGFTAQMLAAGLTAITVTAVVHLALAMIPVTLLDGGAVFAWSKPRWAVFAGLGALGFVHVLLQPTADAAGFVGRGPFLAGLLATYLLAVVVFCTWLRARTPAPEQVTYS